MSEGFYFRRNYGMEYETGVALGETIWVGTLNLREDVESHVVITWNRSLNVYVDGKLSVKDIEGKWRLYTSPMYDPFPNIYLGKANNDRMSEDGPRVMAIYDVTYVDVVYTQQEVYQMTGKKYSLRIAI